MLYDDFVLQIESVPEGGFEARVLQSPAGEGRAPMCLDPRASGIEDLGGDRNRETRKHRDAGAATREIVRRHGAKRSDPREIGTALFRGTFSGQVGSLFDRSLGGLTATQDRGLRIKLKLQGDDPRLAALAALPWELLRRGETDDYLGLDRRTSLVRYLDVPRPRPLIPLPPVLRILVVVAEPDNLDPLELGEELRQLKGAWRKQKRVAVEVLERASLARLREALSEKPYHVIHFMGHGGFDRDTGEGTLYFESKQGLAVPVTGLSLAAKLKDHTSLGLVFLNACNSGRTAASGGGTPFAGVASALVFGGIPAVLAMQFPISDRAAIRFGQAFYRHLAVGSSVDEAVTEGRQAIHSGDPTNVEWATPVLFLRTADGNVFTRPPRRSPWQVAVGVVLLAAALILIVLLQPTLRSHFLPVSYHLESTLIESAVDGVKIQLSRVEMRDDGRMRLYYEVVNDSPEDQPVGFDLGRAYLADEFGNRYEILAAKAPGVDPGDLSAGVAVSKVVAPGGRLESWVELEAPLDGARKLAINLAAQDEAVSFPWLEVELPEYPPRLGRVSKAYEPPPGVLALPVATAIDLGKEQIQGRLTRVELRGDERMRWNLQMLNKGTEAQWIDIDFESSYLLDENGKRYRVEGYDQNGEAGTGWWVGGALRADRWLEFPSPKDGAQRFRVVLYSKDGQEPMTELEVQLPEYDSSFGTTFTAPELGLLPEPVDLINSVENLRSRLVGVESLEGPKQRWHVELHNDGSRPVEVGFSYPQSYLADAHGQRYSVLAAGSGADVRREAVRMTLDSGERSLHSFEFEAGMADPGNWWLMLAGHAPSLRWQPASIGELSFPVGSTRRRPSLRRPPDTAFEISTKQALAPCLVELDCDLEAVFLRPRSMRWRFRFLNQGARQRSIAIEGDTVRLEDEHGNRYRVLGVGAVDGLGGHLAPRLAGGIWLDFGAPLDGARVFEMELGSGLEVAPFEVHFPAYPAALSPSSGLATHSEAREGIHRSASAAGIEDGFDLLEEEAEIETDLRGFHARLVDFERFDGRSRLMIELWNRSGTPIRYGFDLDRTQLSDGVMSSPSRVLRSDTNADPVAVKNRVLDTLHPEEKVKHWFEFVGPRSTAEVCFVTFETLGESEVSFGLLQLDLKN